MVIWAADQRHHYPGHPLGETNSIFVGNSSDVDTGHPGEAYMNQTAAPDLSALPAELKVPK